MPGGRRFTPSFFGLHWPYNSKSHLHDDKAAGAAPLTHVPAMADTNGLPRQRVGFESGEEESKLGNVFDRGEFLVYRLGKHNLLDDALFADAEFLSLFGDLLFDQRRLHKARANDVGADIVLGSFLRHYPRKPKNAVLGCYVGRLKRRGLVAVHRSHIDEHA